MPTAIVIGGGLAGLATAAALGEAGFQVDLFEARGFLGGRATSYPVPGDRIRRSDRQLPACAAALLRQPDGFLPPPGRRGSDPVSQASSTSSSRAAGPRCWRPAGCPAPLHFTGSFWKLTFLGSGGQDRDRARPAGDPARACAAQRSGPHHDARLAARKAPDRARHPPLLESGAGQRDERRSGSHGGEPRVSGFLAGLFGSLQFLRDGRFRPCRWAICMARKAWKRIGNVRLHLRAPVERVIVENGAVRGVVSQGEERTADYYVSALPFERVPAVIPGAGFEPRGLRAFADHRHSLVVRSQHHAAAARDAAGSHHPVDVQQIRRAIRAIGGERIAQPGGDAARRRDRAGGCASWPSFFRACSEAKLEKAHVVKEVRATFSAAARSGAAAAR